MKYIYNTFTIAAFLSFLTSITETIRKVPRLYVSNCVYAYLSFGQSFCGWQKLPQYDLYIVT